MLFTGAKIHKTAGITRVIEKSGKSFTLKGDNETGLKKEMQVYMDHANEVSSLMLPFQMQSSLKKLDISFTNTLLMSLGMFFLYSGERWKRPCGGGC